MKTNCIHVAVTDRSLDVLAITETWHTSSDGNCLRLAAPPGYAVVDVAASSHRGGGVVVIFRNNWKSALFLLPLCTILEPLAVQLSLSAVHFVTLLVYQPCWVEIVSLLSDELLTVLEILVVLGCPVVHRRRLQC